jgi:DNA-binding CsgD family transcriptional regulator
VRRTTPAPDFVGRARELSVLEQALDAARAGAAPVVIVHGEEGIGKTRTVAEFVRAAEAGGAVGLWGTCYQGGVTYAYGPWAQALRGAGCGSREALAPLLSRPGGAPELPPEQARPRLYEAVVRCLDEIERVPMVVLDDLQWADADTLDLLVHVARFGRRPLLILVHRGLRVDVPQLAEVARERRCEYLLLSSLPQPDAAALLARAARRAVEPETLATIYAESGGNPFFLGELGRHLQTDDPSVQGWRPPATVRQAVGLRVAGLSDATRELLQLASVFTAGFSFAGLAALTGLAEAALLDCLDEALAAELLRPAGDDRYDFSHALVRHTLYDRFSPSRRARIHRRLAEALARLDAEQPAEIARQYGASASLPGAERGVPYALAAAAAARAVPAPAEAEQLLGIALDLAREAERASILAELAQVRAEADKPQAALEALTEALDEGAEPVADLVHRVVAVLLDGMASPAAVQPAIARGLASLGGERGLAWARLKLLERPYEVVEAGPVRVARFLGFDPEAVRIAREQGSEADWARTIEQFAQWPLEALDAYMARVAAWSDPLARLRGLQLLAMSATVTRWAGASLPGERLCAELEALGERTGLLPATAIAAVFEAAVSGSRGDFPAALASLERARGLTDRLSRDHRVAAIAELVGDLTLQHVEPDWPAMAERMYAVATRREDGPWFGLLWGAVAAHAFARAGEQRRARELLTAIIPVIAAADPWDEAQGGAVNFAGEAAWDLRAAEVAEPLLDAARALLAAGAGDYYMASSELTVARLSAVLGLHDEAAAAFERARRAADARGTAPLRAIADHDEGIARGWARTAGAAELLSAADTRFEALGMTAWQRRAPARPRAPDGLSARETEVLRLVAAGHTNREIAAELVLSVHTVERHLANAYRKISVRNRADATAYVLRAEL